MDRALPRARPAAWFLACTASVGAPIRVQPSPRRSSRTRAVPGRDSIRTQARSVTSRRLISRSRRRVNRSLTTVSTKAVMNRARRRGRYSRQSWSRTGNPPGPSPGAIPNGVAARSGSRKETRLSEVRSEPGFADTRPGSRKGRAESGRSVDHLLAPAGLQHLQRESGLVFKRPFLREKRPGQLRIVDDIKDAWQTVDDLAWTENLFGGNRQAAPRRFPGKQAGAPVPGRSVGSGVDHVSPRSRDAARKNRQSVVGHLEVATITHSSHYGIIRHDTIHRAPLGEVVGVRHIRADGAMRWRFATSGVEGRSSV